MTTPTENPVTAVESDVQDAAKNLHPAVTEVLRHFGYQHLPAPLAEVSKKLHDLAHEMAAKLHGPMLTTGLHDLLRAKDNFVRAAANPPAESPAPAQDTPKA